MNRILRGALKAAGKAGAEALLRSRRAPERSASAAPSAGRQGHKEKNAVKHVLRGALAAAGTVGAAAFLLAPGRASVSQLRPFRGAHIAHRGLHGADSVLPENSLAAFAAAADNGYGVELDVRLTRDGRVVVFHDDTLERICGVTGRVEDFTWEQLREFRLRGGEERIPLFSEALKVIGGRTPLVVELKTGSYRALLCRLTRYDLRDYPGEYCIQSFDPRIVRWWRKHAPEVLRGQLSQVTADMAPAIGFPAAYALSHLLTNFLARPQFISYGIAGRKPLPVRLCEKTGVLRAAWTCRSPEDEAAAGADMVIFEYYRPPACL